MSEFTSGTLFLKNETERVQATLEKTGLNYKVQALNEHWSAFFVEDEFLQNKKTVEGLRDISQVAPLLSFQNAEDHGWGYSVWDGGEKVASVHVSYEGEFLLTQRLAEERYPDADVIDEFVASSDPEQQAIWEALQAEVVASDKYKQTLARQYAHANLEVFQRFGLTAEQITALSEVVTLEFMESNEPWDQVEAFKEILGIEEMSWLSYDYVGDKGEDIL